MSKKMSPQISMTQEEYAAMLAILQEYAAHSPSQSPHGAVGGTKQEQRSGWGILLGFFVFVGVIAWLAYPSAATLSRLRWESAGQFR